MAQEIERKFLVGSNAWRSGARGLRVRQGYLSSVRERTVRVRVSGDQATLTIKGPPEGLTRPEFEYPIPLADAEALLDQLCERPLIDKVRWSVEYAGMRWEIDEFEGENAGLVVAELELADERQDFERPPWIGREVSDDARYQNASLIRHPYSQWRTGD
jgi:adenylate cyclase